VPWTSFSSNDVQLSVSVCGAPSSDPPTVETKGAMTGTTRLFKARGDDTGKSIVVLKGSHKLTEVAEPLPNFEREPAGTAKVKVLESRR
jgi:hypothetical protein